MNIKKVTSHDKNIAVLQADQEMITDVQSALDLVATVSFESGCDRIALRQSQLSEDFFDLRTGIAGEIIQKFINYNVKVAIIGDFSGYTSRSLRDFIYECNQGKDLFFVASEQEAVEKLGMAR